MTKTKKMLPTKPRRNTSRLTRKLDKLQSPTQNQLTSNTNPEFRNDNMTTPQFNNGTVSLFAKKDNSNPKSQELPPEMFPDYRKILITNLNKHTTDPAH